VVDICYWDADQNNTTASKKPNGTTVGLCLGLADGIIMSLISLKVNGQKQSVEVDPTTPLLFVLSDELGLRSGTARGRGIACVAYEGDNGFAALVADVTIELASEVPFTSSRVKAAVHDASV